MVRKFKELSEDVQDFVVQIEMLKDAFGYKYFLKLKQKSDNELLKYLLGSMLMMFAPIFSYEVVKDGKYGVINHESDVTKTELEKARNRILKMKPTEESDHAKLIIKEMEIDFEQYVFDFCFHFHR